MENKLTPRWPREYLSHSQLDLWEKNPKNYILKYVYGEQQFETEALKLGKNMATVLEEDKSVADPMFEQARIFLPKYEFPEHEIKVDIGGMFVMGKLDGFTVEELHIGEYKTGRVRWNQYRVDTATQLTYYAMLVYKKYGNLPKRISLHWMPTDFYQNEEGFSRLGLTGEIVSYETSRTLVDVLKMMARCKKAWKEIGEACAVEYAAIGM